MPCDMAVEIGLQDAPAGPEAILGYTIQISKNNLFTQVVHTGNPVLSNYMPTVDLPKGMTLYWRVQTKGANGPSAWSSIRSFTSANSSSTPVLSLPASNALIKDYLPLFKWSAVTMPLNTFFGFYRLQVDDNSDFSSPVLDDTSVTDRLTPQFQAVTPLAQNTKYVIPGNADLVTVLGLDAQTAPQLVPVRRPIGGREASHGHDMSPPSPK